jgi:hypothetical protein
MKTLLSSMKLDTKQIKNKGQAQSHAIIPATQEADI